MNCYAIVLKESGVSEFISESFSVETSESDTLPYSELERNVIQSLAKYQSSEHKLRHAKQDALIVNSMAKNGLLALR